MNKAAQYNAACNSMAAAAQAWRARHPHAELHFTPLLYPGSKFMKGVQAGTPLDKVVIVAALSDVIPMVAANADTTDLLNTLDRAASRGGGASLLMAEAVIEHVFGIPCFARVARGADA